MKGWVQIMKMLLLLLKFIEQKFLMKVVFLIKILEQ